MIRLFNTNHPSVYISLLLLSLASRLSVLVAGLAVPQEIDILDVSFSIHGVAAWLLESFVVLVVAVLLNFLLTSRQLVDRRTHLPAFGFIVFSSFGSVAGSMLMVQVSTLLALIAFICLAELKNEKNPVSALFFGGLFIALATTLVPETLFVLFPALYVLTESKIGYGRSIFLLILGFTTALYFIWTGYFLFDKGFVFIDTYLASFQFTLPKNAFEATGIAKLFMLLIFTSFGIISTIASDAWKNVEPRRWFSMWMASLLLFAVTALFSVVQVHLMGMIALGLAALTAPFFLSQKRRPLRETMFVVLLLAALLFQLAAADILAV